MNKEFHKKQNFFSFSDIDSERKDRIMKFTSTEATPAPHVPPGVLRLTGAAKEDIPMYRIQTMNKISPVGLNRFPSELYEVGDAVQDPQGILVRSAKLLDLEFNPSLLAIARAGVGVNNIPLDRCAAAGIPVFSTPGANANAVKELVICAMLMGSRDIPGAIRWVREQAASGVDVSTVVEKGKSAFIGPELYKKTLGIIGLGAIGSIVANTAISLGMDVYGYDPFLSVDTALRLDRHVHVVKDINDLYKRSDYITMHIHYTEKTAHMINADAIAAMKRGVRVINLARGEIVDDEAVVIAKGTHGAASAGKASVVDFGKITYDAPGEHDYLIREVVPAGGRDANTVYDTRTYSVHVSVTDQKDGTLKVTSDASGDEPMTFLNKQASKNPSGGDDPNGGNGGNGDSHTRTGDQTPIAMAILLLLISACAGTLVLGLRRSSAK